MIEIQLLSDSSHYRNYDPDSFAYKILSFKFDYLLNQIKPNLWNKCSISLWAVFSAFQ